MKIYAFCPSIHQDKYERMYNSYDVTVTNSTKLITLNSKGSITKLLNEAFQKYNDGDFYIVLNDDLTFETPRWDVELAHKGRISHGDDGIEGGVKGQFLMIPGNFCRAVGWIQMPKLNRYAGDVVWRFIGEQLNVLDYHPQVVITHRWDGCAEPLVNELDMASFAEWLPSSHKDIEKIRRVIS